jgi:hypothetical protein
MYNKDYVKAIKYMHEENIFSYPEGHQLHESNIHAYTDWLQEHGKDTLADVIRGHVENKHETQIDNLEETVEDLHGRNPPTVSLDDGDRLIDSYTNGVPVVNTGFRTLWVYHPNTSTNKITTYKKRFDHPKDMNEYKNKLKEEGLTAL